MKLKELYHDIFESDNKKVRKLDIEINEENIESITNIVYGKDEVNNIFDIHFPKGNNEKLPTIFVVHGGGYVTGQKENMNRYVKALVEHGYCVINAEYTKVDGKEKKYMPTPVYEMFDLFNYIEQNTEINRHIDFNNFFLTGDSAGGHIISLIANIQTNPNLKFDFNLKNGPQVKGLILINPVFGQYKFAGLPLKNEYHNLMYGANNVISNICHNFDVITDLFPPTMITSTPNDFVARIHTKMFLKIAKNLNLNVSFYDITKGYQLFHSSMIKYADKYPNFIEKICNFIDNSINNKLPNGVNKYVVKEEKTKGNLNNKINQKNIQTELEK